MNTPSDFVLCSSEGYGLEQPRNCWIKKRFNYKGKEHLLIELEKPILSRDLNGNEFLLDQIVVSNRHSDFLPYSEKYPIYVFISKLKEAFAKESDVEMELIAWGELYPSKKLAFLGVLKTVTQNEQLDLDEDAWKKKVEVVKCEAKKIIEKQSDFELDFLNILFVLKSFPRSFPSNFHLFSEILSSIEKTEISPEKVISLCKELLVFDFEGFRLMLIEKRNLK